MLAKEEEERGEKEVKWQLMRGESAGLDRQSGGDTQKERHIDASPSLFIVAKREWV